MLTLSKGSLRNVAVSMELLLRTLSALEDSNDSGHLVLAISDYSCHLCWYSWNTTMAGSRIHQKFRLS